MSTPESSPVPAPHELPAVGGRRLDCSNATFERRALIALANEQAKLSPDNSLIALYCDAVRLTREYSDAMNDSDAMNASVYGPAPLREEKVPDRIIELAERMTIPGGKCDHVSASEVMEITDWIFELQEQEKTSGIPEANPESGEATGQKIIALFRAIREYTTERDYQNVQACHREQDRLEREMLTALDEAEKCFLSSQGGSSPASEVSSLKSPRPPALREERWTAEHGDQPEGATYRRIFRGNHWIGNGASYENAKSICDAHNATLSRLEQELAQWREIERAADEACSGTPTEAEKLEVNRAMLRVIAKESPQLLAEASTVEAGTQGE